MTDTSTTWPIFLAIVAAYVVLSLMIGAKKAYFEPWDEPAGDSSEEKK
jgi:hypothetical protein